MVFSALTLEAYINQQYASHKEISKFDLRKFEVREKWKMLPLLLGLTGGKTEVPGFLSAQDTFQRSQSLPLCLLALAAFPPPQNWFRSIRAATDAPRFSSPQAPQEFQPTLRDRREVRQWS
jgi:hypothetical protein